MAQSAPESQGQNSTAIDVGAQHLGTIYAKAFVGAGEAAGQTDALLEEFDSLLVDVLDPNPGLVQLLSSSFIDPEEKIGILDRVLGQQASPLLLNFLKVLARHGRLDVIRQVHQATRRLVDEMRGRSRVKVTTAIPLDSGAETALRNKLVSMLGSQPVFDMTVDPDLIGGVVVHVGDTVFDGSVATQLRRAHEQMIHRSVHEIQSGRNRFRNSEGN